MNKIWYLKFPTYKYYDIDVKVEAQKAKAKIIDERFQGDEKSADDCPKIKGVEPKKESPKKRTVKKKDEPVIVKDLDEQ